jgi:hypothetical protein
MYVVTRTAILRSRHSYGFSLAFLPFCFALALMLNMYFILEVCAMHNTVLLVLLEI